MTTEGVTRIELLKASYDIFIFFMISIFIFLWLHCYLFEHSTYIICIVFEWIEIMYSHGWIELLIYDSKVVIYFL